jgi:hypothetical protein
VAQRCRMLQKRRARTRSGAAVQDVTKTQWDSGDAHAQEAVHLALHHHLRECYKNALGEARDQELLQKSIARSETNLPLRRVPQRIVRL